jgi:hypothetical protein
MCSEQSIDRRLKVYGLSEYLITLQEAEKVRRESKARKTPREAPAARENGSSASVGYTDQRTPRR